jgi:hypothetical protein
VNDRHFEVHQDYVRALGRGQLAALFAVFGRENLEIANPLKAHLEHVEVIVVAFDVEHFGHCAPFIPALRQLSARQRGGSPKGFYGISGLCNFTAA